MGEITNWASLAPELLAFVLQRVQEGAGERGEGRRVVALAGVCSSWRRSVLQEFHRQPSVLLSFPTAILQPAPSESNLIRCLLKKTDDTFRLVQVVDGVEYFLLGARKKYSIGSSYFRISTDPRILWTQGHDHHVIVSSNFWRTAFTLQGSLCASNPNTPTSKPHLSLKYEEVAVEGNCLRKMRCSFGPLGRNNVSVPDMAMGGKGGWWSTWLTGFLKWNQLLNFSNPGNHPRIKGLKNCAPSPPQSESTVTRFRSSSSISEVTSECGERVFSLTSKPPDWDEQQQCWSLDYNGRAAIVESVHNFQLVSSDHSSDSGVVLQVGRLCKGLFILDFGAPLSPLEALAISLSSFATSVGLDT